MALFDTASRNVRPAAVAGLFYPDRPERLRHDVDDALARARQVSLGKRTTGPKALIAPHAGYIYSGRVAAAAYAPLRARKDITRVVLLGPCHRVPLRGIALPEAAAFETPLGEVRVDRAGAAAIASLPQVVTSAAAHAHEHSLEVQLPFLQTVLSAFELVPLAVGDATPQDVAQVVERLWGGPETLVVVSSDLSHYHSHASARMIDDATVRAILALDGGIDHGQACGATPIAGLLEVAKRRNLTVTLLDQCTSGDTAGDRDRVVGYAAFAFDEPAGTGAHDAEAQGATLVALARGAIREALGGPGVPRVGGAWLDVPRATFVTLRRQAMLRGCVGSLSATRPLREDVMANARAAALADPRFTPLDRDELPATRVEVSVLDAPVPLVAADRRALVAQLVPGADGLIVMAGRKRATFLPQVWEAVPDAATFVAELLRKAGLPEDTPPERCRFARYGVRKWVEREVPE